MVTRRISAILLLRVLFVTALNIPFAAASTDLNISVSEPQVELGKSVKLRLHSSQTSVSLSTIDLTPLLDNFHIKDTDEIELHNAQQSKVITLYPRTTGQLLIPGLHFLKSAAKPVPLNVTPAIDPKDGSRIEVSYSVSTLTPWKKQQVLVRLDLTSHSSILVLHTPHAYADSSEIIGLDVFSEPANDKNHTTLHNTGWVIFPRQPGKHTIELPAIQLIRDGVTTHRFYPPYLKLAVRPLPVYIPATMPVGKLLFTADTPQSKMLISDTIYNTSFSLKAIGVMPASLPSLAAQLKSSEAISFYPATRNSTQTTTRQGLLTMDSYLVSYKANQQGMDHLGMLNINYFDPDTGTINTITQDLGSHFAFSHSLLVLVIFLIIVAGYFIITASYNWLSAKWRCLSGYYRILKSLSDMNQPADIKRGLMNIAEAENWHSNLTLHQWHQKWSTKLHIPCPLNIPDLEKMLYKGKKSDIHKLRQEMRQLCLGRWPVLKMAK
ncbi:MAG: hypothetical protein P8Y24_09760 [Gammaproteobacteria bacterium]